MRETRTPERRRGMVTAARGLSVAVVTLGLVGAAWARHPHQAVGALSDGEWLWGAPGVSGRSAPLEVEARAHLAQALSRIAEADPRVAADLAAEHEAELALKAPEGVAFAALMGTHAGATLEVPHRSTLEDAPLDAEGADHHHDHHHHHDALAGDADSADGDSADAEEDEMTSGGDLLGTGRPVWDGPIELTRETTVSIGHAHEGWLVNGAVLESTPRIKSRRYANYGTTELVESIRRAVERVHAEHGGAHRLVVGDLSADGGGRLRRHLSHQSGRDADIGYYFLNTQPEHLQLATPRTLDVPRTWTLIAALIEGNQAEYVFVDHGLQKPLYHYARDVAKVPAEALESIFQYPRGRNERAGIIRHLKGHADHLHLRLWAPRSVAAATPYLRKYGNSALRPVAVHSAVRKGDTLIALARRHKVKVADLTRWNRISVKTRLRIGQKLVVGWRRPPLPRPGR